MLPPLPFSSTARALLLALLLPATLTMAAETAEPKPADKPTTAPAEKKAPATKTDKPADKPAEKPASTPAEQIMRDLEQAARGRETSGGVSTAPVASPSGAPEARSTGRLMREGSFITTRKGRMTRSGAGPTGGDEWLFAFDGDASGKVDPPMVIMPCMNLAAMEKLVEKGGDSVSFSLSGQVFLYKGRNYLLPTVYVVNRKGELAPAG